MDIPIASQSINFPGYGMFWVANSIGSTLLGWNNRRLQEKAHERDQEFKLEMERAKNITEDKKIQEDIAFKRRMVSLARQYRQEEATTSFENQLKAVELQTYLMHCWPLDPQLPSIILEETKKNYNKTGSSLNVVLLRTPLLPQKRYGGVNDLDADIYNKLEYLIYNGDALCIGNVVYRKDACSKGITTEGNAAIMNIHFLMSQLPTLIISPRYSNGKMYFKGAVWEPQAARPLIRPLFSFDYLPEDALNSKEYQTKVIGLLHTSISIITGAVRDSYMLLTQGKVPTLNNWLNDGNHKEMKAIVNEQQEMKQFIRQENKNILEALEEKNMPHLLEVFNEEDIKSMREQVKSNI